MIRLIAGLAAASAFGQPNVTVEAVQIGVASPMPHGAAQTISYTATVDGDSAIKNAPYTAEAETETIRTLSDGTRIIHKNTSFTARDKEGRTRRETRLANVGPWTTGGPQPPRMAFISDPAAGETIVLDLNAKTARRMKRAFAGAVPLQAPPAGVRNIEGGPTVVRNRVMATEAVGAGIGPAALPLPPLPPVGGAVTSNAAFFRADPKNVKTEDLGKQTMEGVLVEGSRHTVTIPTGEIGNDRPLVSVSERWSSPELKMTILSKTTDPQFGESTHRVIGLKREEPPAELFQIPADFKLLEPHEPPAPAIHLRRAEPRN